MRKICFATRNVHKIHEVKIKLGDDFYVVSLDELGCTEDIPETTGTIEGNSKQKAAYIWEKYQIDCFADDSGLEVKALNGAPGVDSAFYSGSRIFADNIALLLKNLEGVTDREAQFKTVITLVVQGQFYQFEGIIKGEILLKGRGEDGFGYDPVFLPEGEQRSFAEMELTEKNLISHRAKATEKLISFLRSLEQNS